MSDLYLFRNTMRDLFRPGKLAAVVLLAGLLVLIAFLARFGTKSGGFDPVAAYDQISAKLVFGFMLVILSVVFSTGAIVQEIEQKTIPYLLTRPIPRWRILVAKYIAIVIATIVVTCLTNILVAITLLGPTKLGQCRLWQDCLVLPVGALPYCGMFLLLSTIFERPLLIGLAYAFGWESWTPYLPGDWSKVSLMSYVHALAPHLDAANAANADSAISPVNIAGWLAWTVLLCWFAITLAGAIAIFSNREYTPREERA
jgi:ABC-type transport system involved in multi-copper enzyme maturation permease subunit